MLCEDYFKQYLVVLMLLSLLRMMTEAGITIMAMVVVEVEEEDVVLEAVDVEDTMDLRLVGWKMEATIMKPFHKVAVVGCLPFFLFI